MNSPDHVPDKELVTGGSGTGKTTLAYDLFCKSRARLKFVYDHDGRFASRFGPAAVSADGMDEAVAAGGVVVYSPLTDFPSNFGCNDKEQGLGGLSYFCDYVMAVSQVEPGCKLVWVDELDIVAGQRRYPRSLHILMQTGRGYQIDTILITGQTNMVHNCILSQCTSVHTFLLTADPSMKWLTDNGIPAEEIRKLGPHGRLYKNLRDGTERKNGRAVKRNTP